MMLTRVKYTMKSNVFCYVIVAVDSSIISIVPFFEEKSPFF